MKKIFIIICLPLFILSCVPGKQFTELNTQLKKCESENLLLQQQNQNLLVDKNELKANLNKIKDLNNKLNLKITSLNNSQNNTIIKNEQLQKTVDELNDQVDILKNGSSEEISLLLDKLQKTQSDIQSREDKLRNAQFTLEEKNAKLIELQSALEQKNKAVANLKQKVIDALTGFENKGLSVEERNGKVYVSMEERLLFKTGQWTVDQQGINAISNLSQVLAKNPDINILVEGHTDDVTMHGSGQVKDNWDLSVMRATAVTKIILQNKDVAPERITAAGRSEFIPLINEKTLEARQKNRRTEIILSPKLDELFKILNQN